MSMTRYDLQPMLYQKLPKSIDALTLCRQGGKPGKVISGKLDVIKLDNVKQLILDDGTVPLWAKLCFAQDEAGYAYIQGSLEVTLTLTCQRCLTPLEYPLHSTFLLSPISDDAQAKHLPQAYEPARLIDERWSIVEFISEEIILNLPLVPKHLEFNYKIKLDELNQVEPTVAPRENPFIQLPQKLNKK
jgi:uncharacterized protein